MAPEEPEGRSPVAGVLVLAALGGVPLAVLWTLSDVAGVLAVWVVGVTAVWWSARRRKGTDLPLPSPTGPLSPEGELPGHGPITESHREGMSIFLRDDDTNPARTHVRVELHDETAA